MNEPDRPRRDVSIEEAERMPMSDEELDALEATIRESFYVGYEELTDPLLALVAEVRRLRDKHARQVATIFEFIDDNRRLREEVTYLRAMVDAHKTGGFQVL